MMLHTFEYVVRHALLEWWSWMTSHAVDINAASLNELLGVSGIGPSRAGAILEYRNANGEFDSFIALQQVRGIGKNLSRDLGARTTLIVLQ